MTPGREPARLWRDRRFATYWAGDAVSTFGDRISELALPLIAVTMLHASPIEVGLLVAAVWAPNLLSVIVGAWVEQRPSKQRLMVIANLIQAAGIASLPIAHLAAEVTLAQLYVVALVQGAGGVLHATSSQPFFVRLVPKRSYVEANSLLSGTRSASFVAGPALGGALIQAVTAPVAMLVDAVSFLVAAGAIRAVRIDESPAAPSEESEATGSLGSRIRSGLRFVGVHSYLRPALCCVTTCNFFSFILFSVLILFASRSLGLSPGEIGLAFGIGATGGLLGAALAGRLARRIGTGRAVVLGSIAFSLPFLALPLASGSTLTKCATLAAVQFVSAAGVMLFDVNLNSVQTAVIPDQMRSRVTGVFGTINYGVRPVGAALGGFLADRIGIGPVIVIAAIGGSLAFLWLLRTPVLNVRRVDDLQATSV